MLGCTLGSMAKKFPIKGKHYIVQRKPNFVQPAVRYLAKCHGDYFVLYNGASCNLLDLEDFWPLPPDGEPLGEVNGSKALEQVSNDQ